MKISIVILIYNVEQYVRECIESVINQTYKNLEIFLVDDGSTDNCSKICDEYATKDERIKVIHKPNGGVVSGCLSVCGYLSGKYVCFIDGDDYVSLDYIETFLQENCGEDMICMNCSRVYPDGTMEKKQINYYDDCDIYVNEEFLSGMITDEGSYKKYIANARWGKLIKTSLYLEYAVYCSTEVTFGEDQQLTVGLILGSQRIKLLNAYKYYYRYNPQSIVNSYKKDLFQKSLILMKTIENIPGVLQIEKGRKQIDTQLLMYLNECIRNEFFYKQFTYSYFIKIRNHPWVKLALADYMDAKMGKLDKIMILFIKSGKYFGLRLFLSAYKLYCKQRKLQF